MAGECLQTRWTSSLLSSGTDLRGPRSLRLATTKLLVDSRSCCRRQIGRPKYSSGRNARPCKLASKLVVAVAGAAEEEEDTVMDEEKKQQKNNNKKVVVVGAGWAGLGAAHHLTKQVGLLCSSQCRRSSSSSSSSSTDLIFSSCNHIAEDLFRLKSPIATGSNPLRGMVFCDL